MLDRAACERRVYRLALLLTGSPASAVKVIAAVVGAQPDLRRLDGAHLDRLTILRSREVSRKGRGAEIVGDTVAPEMAAAVAAVPQQAREAWILHRVYRLGEREAAKAMDCSITAGRRHLELAERSLAESLPADAGRAGESLLRYSLGVDVPDFFRARLRRRRRGRLVLRLALLMLAGAVLVAAALWATGRHIPGLPPLDSLLS